MNDSPSSTALAVAPAPAPVDFDAALRRLAAGSARQSPRDASPAQTPASDTARALNAEAHALVDRIDDDVLGFLARQIDHKAGDVREPTAPRGGGNVALDLHERACLNAKLRRIADACAMLAPRIG